MVHAEGLYLVDDCGARVGPFSSHWAACAAMIRLHDPEFVSLGGDRADDLALSRSGMTRTDSEGLVQ